ncbi:MAG TPA: CocE/NonD family hydrolase [Ktedonobacterales bacterium]|jgi:putative CocE/NonD family hydrolase|nr:CocE/NonD family hydrolase [Ktedonobacterales bacterium]
MNARPSVTVKAEYDVPATMRDGVTLRANVFRPDDAGAGTYPVLLTRLPYGKDLALGSSILDPAQAARRGFIVVVQDVRGTFTSEGVWYPFKHEREDGVDSVAWAARLPGSNGQVGMYGASYFGQTQWMAAGAPELRAMAPMITWANAEETALRDGVLEWGVQASWLLQQGLGQIVRRHGNDPQTLGKAVYGMVSSYDSLPTRGYHALPLDQFEPLIALDLNEPLADTIRARDTGDFDGLLHGPQNYDNIEMPMLHIGGWYDIFLKGTIRNFSEMRRRGRPGQHLLIGPWTHGNFAPMLGDVYFGMASSGALLDYQIDLMSLQLQFFDRYLNERPGPFDRQPPVKYFVMGANVWKTAESWPPAEATEQRWYLHGGGHANSVSGDGALSPTPPGAEPADHYVYDPRTPTPTVGGPTLMHSVYRSGPLDQAWVERRDDVLVFTSETLERPLEVTGPVMVTLHVATDAPDTDFVARLVDVYPDGRAIPVTDGITRMRYRNGYGVPAEPLSADQSYEIAIDLWATSVMFLPGHRVRLDVTSSSFPRWERNLNTGQSSATTAESRPARQIILHDDQHPSYVTLSVMPQ